MKVYLNDNSVCIKPESKIEDIAIRENEESLRKLFNELVEETKKRNALTNHSRSVTL